MHAPMILGLLVLLVGSVTAGQYRYCILITFMLISNIQVSIYPIVFFIISDC